MRIYRIENQEGVGPFSKDYFQETVHKDFYNDYFWPKLNEFYDKNHYPNKEQDGFEGNDGLFGCKHIGDFTFWFSNDLLVALDAMDFSIAEYAVDEKEVKEGKSGKQIVFNDDYAFFVKEMSLEGLYSLDSKKKPKILKNGI